MNLFLAVVTSVLDLWLLLTFFNEELSRNERSLKRFYSWFIETPFCILLINAFLYGFCTLFYYHATDKYPNWRLIFTGIPCLLVSYIIECFITDRKYSENITAMIEDSPYNIGVDFDQFKSFYEISPESYRIESCSFPMRIDKDKKYTLCFVKRKDLFKYKRFCNEIEEEKRRKEYEKEEKRLSEKKKLQALENAKIQKEFIGFVKEDIEKSKKASDAFFLEAENITSQIKTL